MRRADELGAITDEPPHLTRTFHSPAMRRANALVGKWMREAGLAVSEDAAFNLLGRLESPNPRAKTFLLGSHLDTVRNAGKYDGPLGVLVAIATLQHLRETNVTLPFAVEVAGFSDEEGVRYQTAYLGSRAMAGTLAKPDLKGIAEKGIERARRKPGEFFGYAEVHIEQGPVLESCGLGVGVVTAIAGQSRVSVEFFGRAGHAGTTPMNLRHDALCAAAELILAVEKSGVTATVGEIKIAPCVSNVIPERATLSLDVRHQKDARRLAALRTLRNKSFTNCAATPAACGMEIGAGNEHGPMRCEAYAPVSRRGRQARKKSPRAAERRRSRRGGNRYALPGRDALRAL